MKHFLYISLACLCLVSCVGTADKQVSEQKVDSLVSLLLAEIDTTCILPDKARSFLSHCDLSQTVLYKKPSYRIQTNYIEATEPLGFRGENYQRFYIHWDSIYKQSLRLYRLEGRTRCKDQYCHVSGIMAVQNVEFSPLLGVGNEIHGRYAMYALQNDSLVAKIQGDAIYYFFVENGTPFYSTNCIMDAECGREHRGVWIDLRTNDTLTCNWGDLRIPDSGDLDQGWGCFYVNKKYYDYGWKTLYDCNHLGSSVQPNHPYYDSINQTDINWWKFNPN